MKKYKIYTNGEIDKRVYDGDEPPTDFHLGSHYIKKAWNKGLSAKTDERVRKNVEKAHLSRNKIYHQPWNKGLTKETDNRVLKNVQNMMKTIENKYGVNNISQYLSKDPNYQIWNKGLTKETDDRVKKASDNHKGVIAWNKGKSIEGHPHSKETKEKLHNSHINPEFKQKRYETMKNNNTLFTKNSKAEENYYKLLLETYKETDIIRQYFDKERYPFKCDFYIIPEDKFIEINANWTHGGKPYDSSDIECQNRLKLWQEKSKTSKYYQNAIYTWTDLDVRKLNIAKQNNLNFEMIY